jgi:hypothetical protein
MTGDKKIEDQLGTEMLKNAALADDIELKEAENDALRAEVERLKALSPADETAAYPSVPAETCEIDGVEYGLVVTAFIHNAKSYISSEAIKDKELITELVNINSGLLKVIE